MADLKKNTLSSLTQTELRFAPIFTEHFRSVITDMLATFEEQHTLSPITPETTQGIITTLHALWSKQAEDMLNLMAAEFEKGFTELENKANREAEITRIVTNYATRFGARRAGQIVRTNAEQVDGLVRGGMARGDAAATVINDLLRRAGDISSIRAALVSRTEAHAMSQFASQQLAERSQIPLTKIWNTEGDERVRDFGLSGRVSEFNHRVMEGFEVPLMGMFKIPTTKGGFEMLTYPGDPNGSAGNVINCRCIQTYRRIN